MQVSLDGDALVKVIKECKRSGVVKFTAGEVEILFESVAMPIEPTKAEEPSPVAIKTHEDSPQLEFSQELDEELADLELALSDPSEWQKQALDQFKAKAMEGDEDEEA